MEHNDELYTITLTKKQMRLIANCVEDCSRFLAGQCELGFTLKISRKFRRNSVNCTTL